MNSSSGKETGKTSRARTRECNGTTMRHYMIRHYEIHNKRYDTHAHIHFKQNHILIYTRSYNAGAAHSTEQCDTA